MNTYDENNITPTTIEEEKESLWPTTNWVVRHFVCCLLVSLFSQKRPQTVVETCFFL